MMQPVELRRPRRGRDFVLPDVPMLRSPEWSDEDNDINRMSVSPPNDSPVPIVNSSGLYPKQPGNAPPAMHPFGPPIFVRQAMLAPAPTTNAPIKKCAFNGDLRIPGRLAQRREFRFAAALPNRTCDGGATREPTHADMDHSASSSPENHEDLQHSRQVMVEDRNDEDDVPPVQPYLDSFVNSRTRDRFRAHCGSLFSPFAAGGKDGGRHEEEEEEEEEESSTSESLQSTSDSNDDSSGSSGDADHRGRALSNFTHFRGTDFCSPQQSGDLGSPSAPPPHPVQGTREDSDVFPQYQSTHIGANSSCGPNWHPSVFSDLLDAQAFTGTSFLGDREDKSQTGDDAFIAVSSRNDFYGTEGCAEDVPKREHQDGASHAWIGEAARKRMSATSVLQEIPHVRGSGGVVANTEASGDVSNHFGQSVSSAQYDSITAPPGISLKLRDDPFLMASGDAPQDGVPHGIAPTSGSPNSPSEVAVESPPRPPARTSAGAAHDRVTATATRRSRARSDSLRREKRPSVRRIPHVAIRNLSKARIDRPHETAEVPVGPGDEEKCSGASEDGGSVSEKTIATSGALPMRVEKVGSGTLSRVRHPRAYHFGSTISHRRKKISSDEENESLGEEENASIEIAKESEIASKAERAVVKRGALRVGSAGGERVTFVSPIVTPTRNAKSVMSGEEGSQERNSTSSAFPRDALSAVPSAPRMPFTSVAARASITCDGDRDGRETNAQKINICSHLRGEAVIERTQMDEYGLLRWSTGSSLNTRCSSSLPFNAGQAYGGASNGSGTLAHLAGTSETTDGVTSTAADPNAASPLPPAALGEAGKRATRRTPENEICGFQKPAVATGESIDKVDAFSAKALRVSGGGTAATSQLEWGFPLSLPGTPPLQSAVNLSVPSRPRDASANSMLLQLPSVSPIFSVLNSKRRPRPASHGRWSLADEPSLNIAGEAAGDAVAHRAPAKLLALTTESSTVGTSWPTAGVTGPDAAPRFTVYDEGEYFMSGLGALAGPQADRRMTKEGEIYEGVTPVLPTHGPKEPEQLPAIDGQHRLSDSRPRSPPATFSFQLRSSKGNRNARQQTTERLPLSARTTSHGGSRLNRTAIDDRDVPRSPFSQLAGDSEATSAEASLDYATPYGSMLAIDSHRSHSMLTIPGPVNASSHPPPSTAQVDRPLSTPSVGNLRLARELFLRAEEIQLPQKVGKVRRRRGKILPWKQANVRRLPSNRGVSSPLERKHSGTLRGDLREARSGKEYHRLTPPSSNAAMPLQRTHQHRVTHPSPPAALPISPYRRCAALHASEYELRRVVAGTAARNGISLGASRPAAPLFAPENRLNI